MEIGSLLIVENQYFYSRYIFSLESGVAKVITNWISHYMMKCRQEKELNAKRSYFYENYNFSY